MPPVDMAVSVTDLPEPGDMAMMPPSGARACPSPSFCWENPLPQPRTLYAVWGTGPSDIWTAGELGVALHWDGRAWTQPPTGTTQSLRAIWGLSANEVWVVGNGGTILFWDGMRFSAQTSGTSESLYGIGGRPGAFWAVGSGGKILRNNGASWSGELSGTTSALYAVWSSALNNAWIAGQSGTACHYGGSSWTCSREFSAASNAIALTGTGKDNIWMLGSMAEAWQWNGTAWAARPRGASASTIFSAIALSPTNIWAVGQSTTALHYDGTSWAASTLGSSTSYLYGIWGSGPSNLYAVGTSGEIQRYDGGSFTPLSSGWSSDVTAMWGVSDRDLWVFTADRTARHFDGSRWTSSTLPGVGYSATGSSGKDLWVGSDGGRIFRYDGSSWSTAVTKETGTIHAIYIAASDRVVVGGDTSIQFWDGARFTIAKPEPGYAAWGTGPNNIWVGSGGNCNIERYNGATWDRDTIGVLGNCSGPVVGISGTGPSDVYVASESAPVLWRWDGTKYTAISIGTTHGKTAVYATPTRVFVTTSVGEIVTGLAGSWNIAFNAQSRMDSIAGFAADKAWIGGKSGFVLSYKP
jgi:hypothetical protein